MPRPGWRQIGFATIALFASLSSYPQVSEQSSLDELILARDSYRQAGDLQAAQAAALAVTLRVETDYGKKAPQLSEPLVVLARIHRDLGNRGEAEITLRRVIDILRSQRGNNGPELIVPYQELAGVLMDAERFPDALTTLEEARSISRRNFGLFNMGQVQLFDDLTSAYLGLNQTAKAQAMQEEKLTLAVRNFGADDLQVAPYREQLADYYQRSRLKVAAREEHSKALAIYANQQPPDTQGALRTLGNILRLNFVLLGDEDEHVRIAELLTNDDISTIERAATLALLGDFYFVRVKDQTQAERYWSEAYRLAQSLPPEDARELAFDKPVILDFVPPLNQVDQRTSRRKRFAWGQLVALFAVDADGRATDIELEMNPPVARLEKRYRDRIAATHFRPRLVDGVPAATSRVRLKHAYRYFVD